MNYTIRGTDELKEMSAEEVDDNDLLLISDTFDKDGYEVATTKTISIKELRKCLANPKTETKWKCLRCGSMVDMVAFRCKCEKIPSPWAPV